LDTVIVAGPMLLRETRIIEQPGHLVTQYQQYTFKDVRCINRLQFPKHRLDSGHESVDQPRDSGVGLVKLAGFFVHLRGPYFVRSSMPCRQLAAKFA
jgi:hypothetical protein